MTEHAPVCDYDRLASHLDELRRAGLRLAVDDAGAGYASLQHILRLAPDVIKLDMSLTRNVHVDPRRRALVAALVPFADQIGATVVAEGIETETELETLCGFGAAWGQGYLLARPLPLDETLRTTSAHVASARNDKTPRRTTHERSIGSGDLGLTEQQQRDVAVFWPVFRSVERDVARSAVADLRDEPALTALLEAAANPAKTDEEPPLRRPPRDRHLPRR